MLEPTSQVLQAPNADASSDLTIGWRLLSRGAWLVRNFLRYAPLILILTIARSTLADQYHVPTASMWPTIEPGDRIFVSKAAYGLRIPFTDHFLIDGGTPLVGEVVIFADPRGGPTPLVKRVVALAGQSVHLKGGVLYVDGHAQRIERLSDGRVVEHLGSVVHEAGSRDFEDYGPKTVPNGHVFVMGDNRAVSLDSRVIGTIPRRLLRGRVVGTVFRYEDETFDATRLLHAID